MQTNPTEVTVTGMVIECASDPLTPVTCTENVPDELPVTVSVAVPEPVTLVGLMVALIPDDAVTVTETTPENPLSAVTVMVDVPDVLGMIVMLEGLADREKSGCDTPLIVTETVTDWVVDPLVPVTVIVYVPGGVELVEDIVRIDVAVPPSTTLVGFNETVSPAGLFADNTMAPVNPLMAATVMVEVPVWPGFKVMLDGLAVMLKHGESVTMTETVVECASTPLAPVTVT
jgi:hypothetical protein